MTSTEDRRELRQHLTSLRPGKVTGPIETPYGTVYPFKSFAVQILVLGAAFAGGPLIAWLLGQALGNTSEAAQIFLTVCFSAVLFLGYGTWAARLASLVMTLFGRKVLWALIGLLFRRTTPRDLQQLIPDRDALTRLLASAQKAAWSFLVAGILVGVVGGALAGWIDSDSGKASQVLVVFLGVILWGYTLGWLGRHGYLPLPEPSE
jgi:hypothetical protein